ncbi:MAG: hypothetical protein OEW67_06125 [Cyclobacteriaceae bacterium]|nr:hypothetical protein [Cyclobacteriaceae bacterium]
MIDNKRIKWLILIFIGVVVAGISGFLHEVGHYITSYSFGFEPQLSFTNGGRVFYKSAIENTPILQQVIVLMAGPLITFLLAIGFTLVWFRFQHSYILFFIALWNSTFRLNVLIDGARSDEWKTSDLLNLPHILIPLCSVIISISLTYLLAKQQRLFNMNYWLIPLGWVLCMLYYKISFGMLSLVYG